MSVRWSTLIAALVLAVTALRAADQSADAIVSRIHRQPVDSAAIAAIGYSKRLHALEIEFRNGAIYRYLEVPIEIHHALMAAESKARFYDHNIRGRFRSLHVKPPSASD